MPRLGWQLKGLSVSLQFAGMLPLAIRYPRAYLNVCTYHPYRYVDDGHCIASRLGGEDTARGVDRRNESRNQRRDSADGR